MSVRRVASALAVLALLVVACGKHGGTPPAAALASTYHLEGARDATSLELRADGSFTLRREACDSIGVLACGRWRTEPTRGRVDASGYWPTPEDFPSAAVSGVTLHDAGGDLLVTVESEWAGRVTQRWTQGRVCSDCRTHRSRPCAEPLPACAL